MSQVIVCDECGQVIDQTQPYYDVVGTLMQLQGEPLYPHVVEAAKQMHYHQDHLPESVLEPAPDAPGPQDPPIEPPDELDEPDDPDSLYSSVVISAMTIKEVLDWVGDDQGRIEWAIKRERIGKNRRELVNQLEDKLAEL